MHGRWENLPPWGSNLMIMVVRQRWIAAATARRAESCSPSGIYQTQTQKTQKHKNANTHKNTHKNTNKHTKPHSLVKHPPTEREVAGSNLTGSFLLRVGSPVLFSKCLSTV
jgi:hypothetical protein